MTTHRLDPTPDTTADVFSRDHAPVLCWLRALLGVGKGRALAIASSCVDLRITQVANQTWGIHAVLPTEILG